MHDSRDPYADIAEWYDVEHDELFEDIECYLALLENATQGAARVLEIGSGTGRIAAKLATAGHSVTGIEPSRAMRDRCEVRVAGLPDRVRRRVRVIDGTATAPNIADAELFDAVLFGLNTLAHLTTVDERQTAMRVAAKLLRPGGQLIIDADLRGPRTLREHLGQLWLQGHWVLPSGASHLTHSVVAIPSDQPDVIEVQHLYDVFEQGGAIRRTLSVMPLALFSYGDVIGGLAAAGFTIGATYGTHDLSPFDYESDRLIVDARLPSA